MCNTPGGQQNELPKVSCLMVTANRRRFCRRSVRCYNRQTYPNRELIVVDDGEQDLTPVLEEVPEEELTHVQLPSDKDHVLGQLRNVALNVASGELRAQWDDDDWYHPKRIKRQVEVMRKGHDACCLHGTLMHVDSPKFVDQPYIGCLPDGVPGTIMHRRDPDVRYPEMRREEDTVYLDEWRQKRYAVLPHSDTHLFIRCFHGRNTWEKNHFLRRIRNTFRDAIAYVWYRYACGDLFQHPRFQLSEKDRQAFGLYLEDSNSLDLLTSTCRNANSLRPNVSNLS